MPARGLMAKRLPFTKVERRRWSQHQFGHRPVNDWGSGDLPAPWAAGDIIEVPEGSGPIKRLNAEPGLYVVDAAFSIDEGDAWYFRVTDGSSSSDRLHVAYAERSTWDKDVNWLEGCTLVDTADLDGLALRERMIADGWGLIRSEMACPRCNGTGRVTEWKIGVGDESST